MEIFIAGNAGFCDGVRRSVQLVEESLQNALGPVVTLGPIVHNSEVVASLARRGARVTASATEANEETTVVIRAHGVTAGEIEKLRSRGATIIDGTCPNVRAIHKKILQFTERGIRIYLAGDPDHAEMAAHLSRGGENIFLINSAEDVWNADLPGIPSALAAQTSFDRDEFRRIAFALKKKIADIEIVDTLCPWMLRAQEAAVALLRWVDCMVVIGDTESTNTARLAAKCKETGKPVFKVLSSCELNESDFTGAGRVGITAGASTPRESIEGVVRWFAEKFSAGLHG